MSMYEDIRKAIAEVDALGVNMATEIRDNILDAFPPGHRWEPKDLEKAMRIIENTMKPYYGSSRVRATKSRVYEVIAKNVTFTANRNYELFYRSLDRKLSEYNPSFWARIRAASIERGDSMGGVYASFNSEPAQRERRIRSKLFDPNRRWVDRDGYRLSDRVWQVGRRQRKQIDRIVREGITRGDGVDTLATKLDRYLNPSYAPVRYERSGRVVRSGQSKQGSGAYGSRRLARTELQRASHASTREAVRRVGVPGMGIRWALSNAHPKIDICDQLARGHTRHYPRGVYSPGEFPEIPHPNCVIGSTIVTGPMPDVVMKRWWSGDVVDIVHEDGRVLTITPNHPVLTHRGWVPAGEIKGGDYIVSDKGWVERGIPSGVPDDQDVIPSIEQVAESIRASPGGSSRTMKPTPEQFHGDFSDSKVNVVHTNRLLDSDLFPPVGEFEGEELFGRANAKLSVLAGPGTFELLSKGVLPSPDRIVSGGDHGHPLIGGHPGEGQTLALASDPESDVRLADDPRDHGSAVEGSISDLLEGLSGLVSPNDNVDLVFAKVDSVVSRTFAGHVYNLDTGEGWYISNGAIVHNCLCSAQPWSPPPASVLAYLGSKYGVE